MSKNPSKSNRKATGRRRKSNGKFAKKGKPGQKK